MRIDVRPTHWREWQGALALFLLLHRVVERCQFSLFFGKQLNNPFAASFGLAR
jgi:hypothetical protein